MSVLYSAASPPTTGGASGRELLLGVHLVTVQEIGCEIQAFQEYVGAQALKHLLESGTSTVMITTRDFRKARHLAGEYNGQAVPFERLLSEMVQADILICSTGAPHYLITPENVSEILQARKNLPVFMIDISVPRNIDPAVNDIDNVFLYDVDDLNTIVQQNINERTAEARQAETIIDEEVENVRGEIELKKRELKLLKPLGD